MMDIEIFICGILLILGICILVVIHACVADRISSLTGEEELGGGGGEEESGVNSNSRRPSMAMDDIDKLPTFEYRVEELEETNGLIMDCAVCLENFRLLDLCRLLPDCKHSFHALCIDLWLAKTAVCPICRREVSLRFEETAGEGSGDHGGVGDGLV